MSRLTFCFGLTDTLMSMSPSFLTSAADLSRSSILIVPFLRRGWYFERRLAVSVLVSASAGTGAFALVGFLRAVTIFLRTAAGLSDYLLHDAPLQDVLFNPGISKLVVLPGREGIVDSSEALSSPRMVALVEELKSRYPSRILLFDLPPLLATDDALAFAPYVDAVLLIVRDGKTRSEDVTQSVEILEGTTPLIGTVLNETDELQVGY